MAESQCFRLTTSKMIYLYNVYFYALLVFMPCFHAKIDRISLEEDQRDLIHLVSYGMYKGGYLDVNISVNYTVGSAETTQHAEEFGLTIDKTTQSSAQVAQYGESRADTGHDCSLRAVQSHEKSILLLLNISTSNTKSENPLDYVSYISVVKDPDMVHVELTSADCSVNPSATLNSSLKKDTDASGEDQGPGGKPGGDTNNQRSDGKGAAGTGAHSKADTDGKGDKENENNGTLIRNRRDQGMHNVDPKQTAAAVTTTKKAGDTSTAGADPNEKLPLRTLMEGSSIIFNVSFKLKVSKEADAGLYSIFFHNCRRSANGKEVEAINSLKASIVGMNTDPKTYLSAGDIPEPYIFFIFSVAYILLSFVWLRVLRNSSSGVFKTHYLMLSVCYCKALAALFHGVNFYYIGKVGKEETAWAVIYYISYLMKTVMLFLTMMLVGTGWTFIKHIFSDKEKKLFLVAIPLQVLVYVSHVIMSETEVATKAYSTWQTISVVVDLLCCAAILLPVIWSIRHLTEASQTNGKAALNLQKLRLFKSLYVMIIAYIYITRIVILVFRFTLPYQLSWLADFFTEVTVILFLTTLGYKFRPADDNPYFQVPPDSDDEEECEEMAVTQSGLTTDTKRRNLTVSVDPDDIEKQSLLPATKNRRNNESSHELD